MQDSYTNPSETKQIKQFKFLILQKESTKQNFGKQAYKMNPHYESFEKSSTNRIRDTNL